MRATLVALFEAAGFSVATFSSGEAFLAAERRPAKGCIILDMNLPDCSGLEILKALGAAGDERPVVVVSAQADIPTAVAAIKEGAVDFIEKPLDDANLLVNVCAAYGDRSEAAVDEGPDFAGRALLTPRERQVLGQITAGRSNKEAGRELAISPRTVEVHRARIMEKLGAKNAADLVRIVLTGGGRVA
ncbi:MAG TPA: response regulator [Hyphomicrobiales bacterium]|nr:response regulator [Hyphomicrobiales bacterium]